MVDVPIVSLGPICSFCIHIQYTHSSSELPTHARTHPIEQPAMASATRSKKPVLLTGLDKEPTKRREPRLHPCVQCGDLTKWSVGRSGRYNFHSHEYHCPSCWRPQPRGYVDYAGTATYFLYDGMEATKKLIRRHAPELTIRDEEMHLQPESESK